MKDHPRRKLIAHVLSGCIFLSDHFNPSKRTCIPYTSRKAISTSSLDLKGRLTLRTATEAKCSGHSVWCSHLQRQPSWSGNRPWSTGTWPSARRPTRVSWSYPQTKSTVRSQGCLARTSNRYLPSPGSRGPPEQPCHAPPTTSAHIEQSFGWAKLIGPISRVMVRGLDKVDQLLLLNMDA